jgi:hypothetical protein
MSWDGLIEIFNPGHKHFAQERDRKRLEAQIPESEGDPLRDFERGIIRITLPRPPSEPTNGPSEPTNGPSADTEDQTGD